jgi:hypothetical protein
MNIREYQRAIKKWTIQRNWQQCAQDEEKHGTIYVGHHYEQTNTKSVNLLI